MFFERIFFIYDIKQSYISKLKNEFHSRNDEFLYKFFRLNTLILYALFK